MTSPNIDVFQALHPSVSVTDEFRLALEETEGRRIRVLAKRDDLIRAIDDATRMVEDLNTFLAELDGTADRYRRRLGMGVQDPPPVGERVVATLYGPQGDAGQHAQAFGGPETTSVMPPFEPGLPPKQEAAVNRLMDARENHRKSRNEADK